MAAAPASPTVGDILSKVRCPLVEVGVDEPLESIACLLAFCGLDAVLLVRSCGGAERVVSTRHLIDSFSAVERAGTPAPDLLRCSPDDPVFCIAGTMLHGDHDALVVEKDGKRLALITVENLAEYLMMRGDVSE
ncbi:CBS domain-containing protein [Ancylobacter lacus]|uniref:CBS domain-containing protein n=1 Tax=Ancylobacter lacus TaxID=2579970 RepID=UPI001BCB7DA1|nr:CBS domain-containing protein [Ancylobacter lacus]MBS7537516.1 CBS domain-containing protein [Ancylobacter lacus]